MPSLIPRGTSSAHHCELKLSIPCYTCPVQRRQNPLLVLLLVPTFFATGCGYRFVTYERTDGDAQRVSVVTLQNDSAEAGIELLATEALRHEILSRGGLQLIASPERAHYILRGRVIRVNTVSRSFTGVAQAREYEVSLQLELQVDSQVTDVAPIRRTIFRASEIYLASSDAAVMRKNRREALRYLSGLLASRVHDSIDRQFLSAIR